MDIIVCIKQVPDTTNVEVDPVTGVLKRDGVASKLNPYDLYALETAMTLCEKYGGSVSTITMGPPQARESLMESIYMGAQRAALLCDRAFAGADVAATSYALSQGIRKLGQFDLIICGKQTTDGDTAQVGAETAELLGIEHAANVYRIDGVDKTGITLTMNMDDAMQKQQMRLPCLITIEKDANTPRLPSYKRKCAAREDMVCMYTLADLEDADSGHYGLKGSPTQVERIFPPDKNDEKRIFDGTGEELAADIAKLLVARKFIV